MDILDRGNRKVLAGGALPIVDVQNTNDPVISNDAMIVNDPVIPNETVIANCVEAPFDIFGDSNFITDDYWDLEDEFDQMQITNAGAR